MQKGINLIYLKSFILVEKCDTIIEINVIYSEVYRMPTVYFNILKNNNYISYNDFQELIKKENDVLDSELILKQFEISKTVKLF
jgi:hypothetical protein